MRSPCGFIAPATWRDAPSLALAYSRSWWSASSAPSRATSPAAQRLSAARGAPGVPAGSMAARSTGPPGGTRNRSRSSTSAHQVEPGVVPPGERLGAVGQRADQPVRRLPRPVDHLVRIAEPQPVHLELLLVDQLHRAR